jgi:catechol 2,3-dioxygenase-like lactoylglutathione lyase family enzyme
MPTLETYRKQAKLLVRWHRERDYSIGEKVRQLARYGALTDREVLGMKFTLALAQEIVAVDAGHRNWAELKLAAVGARKTVRRKPGIPKLKVAIPILFVRDVTKSAKFFHEKLGFRIDFLHGAPPFYGAVSRDGVCLHLRFVHVPFFSNAAAREKSLIHASIEVENVQGLFEEFDSRGAEFAQKLKKQAWGGTDFHVRAPDGNAISFVAYERTQESENTRP